MILHAKHLLPTLAVCLAPWAQAQQLSNPVPGAAGTGFETTPQKPVQVEPDKDEAGGRLPVQFGLSLAGYYDDNIYAQPKGPNRIGDFIWNVAPVISWNSAMTGGFENAVQISYSPQFIFYQRNSTNDTIDQQGSLVYGYHGSKSDFVLTQQYASVQNNAPDLGDLVKFEEYLTTATFDYQMTAKLGLTLRAQQDITTYDQGLDSIQWTGSAYLNYDALPKTRFALGGLIGAADLEGPNQTFEQVNGRVLYDPTAKLSFNATVGLEFRQTQGYGSSRMTPTFSLGLNYDPFDGTSLNLNAYRNYAYSARYYGNDYLTTGVSGSVSQRFCQRVYETLAASFEDAVYTDNLTNGGSNLSYNYFSIHSTLAYDPTNWCELSIYYQYRENMSRTINAFTDNQAGFQSRFTY